MIGAVRRRLQREREERLELAHDTAALTGAAMAGKLDRLDSYLAKVRPRPRRGVAAMIATLRDAAARGMPLRIARVSDPADAQPDIEEED